jgi:hypothetical protein
MFKNAERPLAIPTYDGSGQCVHPDVILNGRRFFSSTMTMVMEPYPHGDARYENPSIVISDDGHSWSVPPKLRNPVVPARSNCVGWHSDAILYAGRGSPLWMYYRYNSGQGETTLLRRVTHDGTEWANEEKILEYAVSGSFASPAIFAEEGMLHLLFVDTLAESVWSRSSYDGVTWQEPELITRFPNAWHVAARRNRGCLYFLINDRSCLYLLRRTPQGDWWMRSRRAWEAFSEDRSSPTPILARSPRGWDSAFIYHGSFLIDGDTVRIWYSAASTDGYWRIGYTYGSIC